jgi:hypothetical protein
MAGAHTPEMVSSRGIEPRSSGIQPDAMTSLARCSKMEPMPGVEPGPPAYGAGVLPSTLHRRWSRLEDSHPDLPVIGRTSCCWTKPGYGTRPLRHAGATWLTDVGSNHDLRIQSPRSFHLDDLSIGGIGRTRRRSLRLAGRTRSGRPTSTDLRPRQAGYRLPNDPTTDWGDRSDSNRDYGSTSPRAAVTPRSHAKVVPRV